MSIKCNKIGIIADVSNIDATNFKEEGIKKFSFLDINKNPDFVKEIDVLIVVPFYILKEL